MAIGVGLGDSSSLVVAESLAVFSALNEAELGLFFILVIVISSSFINSFALSFVFIAGAMFVSSLLLLFEVTINMSITAMAMGRASFQFLKNGVSVFCFFESFIIFSRDVFGALMLFFRMLSSSTNFKREMISLFSFPILFIIASLSKPCFLRFMTSFKISSIFLC